MRKTIDPTAALAVFGLRHVDALAIRRHERHG